jgi:hypothetical protein
MVKKANGTWRPCGDYRRLNNVTKADRYPVPNIQDFTARLHGCTVFSKLDLRKGYYQVPVRAEDIPKTAIITPFRLCMPFRLKNAGQSFQRPMDRLMAGLNFVLCTWMTSSSPAWTNRCTFNISDWCWRGCMKVAFFSTWTSASSGLPCSLDFLGHRVSAGGLQPLSSHVQAIMEVPRPLDTTQLQRFLGMISFYRRFIPGTAKILLPLTEALKGGHKKQLAWGP